MNLGLITSSYPRFSGDWAGGFVREQALELVRRGHRVTVVCPGSPAPTSDHAVAQLDDPNIEVVRAPVPNNVFYGPGAPERLLNDRLGVGFRALPAVASLFWTARRTLASCDAILGHWLFPGGVLAGLVAGGRPWASITHSTATRWTLSAPPLFRGLVWELHKNARGISTTDPALAGMLSTELRRPVIWLPPHDRGRRLADLILRSGPEKPTRSVPGAPLRVGYLGRPAQVKGRGLLLETVAATPDLEWHLGGPGWDRLCHHEHCALTGELKGDRAVARFMSRIDVLIIPSQTREKRQEGLPTVLLEAWACGVPVLGTPSGALRLLLPPHLQVASENPAALVARLTQVATWSTTRWKAERSAARAAHQRLAWRRDRALSALLAALH